MESFAFQMVQTCMLATVETTLDFLTYASLIASIVDVVFISVAVFLILPVI